MRLTADATFPRRGLWLRRNGAGLHLHGPATQEIAAVLARHDAGRCTECLTAKYR